jgi:hypothetical protein
MIIRDAYRSKSLMPIFVGERGRPISFFYAPGSSHAGVCTDHFFAQHEDVEVKAAYTEKPFDEPSKIK